jgi:hypothetical protein
MKNRKYSNNSNTRKKIRFINCKIKSNNNNNNNNKNSNKIKIIMIIKIVQKTSTKVITILIFFHKFRSKTQIPRKMIRKSLNYCSQIVN